MPASTPAPSPRRRSPRSPRPGAGRAGAAPAQGAAADQRPRRQGRDARRRRPPPAAPPSSSAPSPSGAAAEKALEGPFRPLRLSGAALAQRRPGQRQRQDLLPPPRQRPRRRRHLRAAEGGRGAVPQGVDVICARPSGSSHRGNLDLGQTTMQAAIYAPRRARARPPTSALSSATPIPPATSSSGATSPTASRCGR